ncbi:hypothetical protein [Streptomyces virginiae]
MSELLARTLTWAEVDPLRHPFELDEYEAEVAGGPVRPVGLWVELVGG